MKRSTFFFVVVLPAGLLLGLFFAWVQSSLHAEDEARFKELQVESSNRLEEVNALAAENERLRAALDEWVAMAEQVIDARTKAWMPAGEFLIYHYCPCEYCCGKKLGDPDYGITATGTVATTGHTVAVDPDVIPLGSEVLINGVVYIAEDTGVQGKTIDLFINSHDQASAMGTYTTDVSWR